MSRSKLDIWEYGLCGYEGLEFSIVVQAIDDWFKLCDGKTETGPCNFFELEHFFKTDAQKYMDNKTTISAKEILEWLQEERKKAGA